MKLLQIKIADDRTSDSLQQILEKEKETTTITKIHAGSHFFITLRVSDKRANEILHQLSENKFFEYGEIDVLNLYVSKPDSIKENLSSAIQPVEAIYESIYSQTVLNFDFVSYLVTASLIAGFGLASNSLVSVVAAMLVSPLMGPILAIAFAPIIRDKKLLFIALKTEALSLTIVVTLGAVLGIGFLPFGEKLNWPTSEMTSRGDPINLIMGLLIAIPSGAGVALAFASSGNVNPLVGVAISASLLPPAVNCGICLSYGLLRGLVYKDIDRDMYLSMGGISFTLTIVNILGIIISALIFFKIKQIAPFERYPQQQNELTEKKIQKPKLYHNLIKTH